MSLNYIKNNLSKDEKILLSSKITLWAYIPFVVIFIFFALIFLSANDRDVARKDFLFFQDWHCIYI